MSFGISSNKKEEFCQRVMRLASMHSSLILAKIRSTNGFGIQRNELKTVNLLKKKEWMERDNCLQETRLEML